MLSKEQTAVLGISIKAFKSGIFWCLRYGQRRKSAYYLHLSLHSSYSDPSFYSHTVPLCLVPQIGHDG
jgi:hypothetical protein